MDITIKDFPKELWNRVEQAGLFRYMHRYYWMLIGTMLLGLLMCSFLLFYVTTWWQAILLGGILTFIIGQFGLLGHDITHGQVSKYSWITIFLGEMIWGLILGLSMLWWKDDHNQHHQETNRIRHDTQINAQFVFSPKQIKYIGEFQKKWILPFQDKLFFIFSACMYVAISIASLHYVITSLFRKPFQMRVLVELVLILSHYLAIYFAFSVVGIANGLIIFLTIYFVGGLSMGLTFAPNHKGERILDASEEVNFLTQIDTTRNITPSPLKDFLLGGLNYQIEHHLFPKLPRPLLSQARVIVKNYCAENNIMYHETGLFESYALIQKSLREHAIMVQQK